MEKELKTAANPSSNKPISVTVAVQGGKVWPDPQKQEEGLLPVGATVEDALKASGLSDTISQFGSFRNFKILLRGQEVKNLKTQITDGDQILIVGNVKGGA